MQLKVEQGAFLESDFKRQTEKMKSLEEANKLIEDELGAQSRKKKELEEDLKRTREKFDIFQTEAMMKHKKQRGLTNEDLSSLAIFKSVVAEAGALRNHSTRTKIHELRFAPLLEEPKKKPAPVQDRREIMKAMANMKIGDSFAPIEEKLARVEFDRPKEEKTVFPVGEILLRGHQGPLLVDVGVGGVVRC